jgi:allantoicase
VNETPEVAFTGLLDLAAEGLGGKVLGTSDDFFAGCENLIRPGRAVFVPGKYTERGKWMDGWESRRKRGPGHDWCIVELGVRGRVAVFDIDTQHFLGNHPPFASVDGLLATPGSSLEVLAQASWTEVLPQVPLRPGSQNLFVPVGPGTVSHLRLNIYPDGGIARFRAWGHVEPTWEQHEQGLVDLGAAKNGATPLACSDAFFGPMHQLLLPGRASDMSGGWETRRKRVAGHDWIVIQLAARGSVRRVEVDTNHFKGNYPDRCSLDVIDAPGARITELVASDEWSPLLPEAKLEAHQQHFFENELAVSWPATHVRLNIFPDGGVSRLRLWGKRA